MVRRDGMEFRFVILGAANIASKFCKAVKLVPDCEVAAVASKSLEKAQRFAEAQDILGAYGDYEEMLEKEKPDEMCIRDRSCLRRKKKHSAKFWISCICAPRRKEERAL